MGTQAELAQQIAAVTEKLKKIGTETRALLKKIDELTAIIAAGGNVTAEVQAKMDELTAQADIVDAEVPDEPAPPSP